MTDLSTIRVIPFCGKSDEWPIWSEKFLAKAKRYGFKDVLIGKLSIPKADEEFDEDSVTGKKMKNAIKVNELAYTELLLSIDVQTSFGKVAFNIVRGCKSKDYPDGNATIAWEKLKNKYEPTSAPSMVKLDKQFRDSSLKKGEDPEVWITQLEDISVRLEEMGLEILEKQFMIHVLNNIPPDYDLQVALLERRIGDEKDPLTVSEIRSELSLRFERLNNHSNNENGEASEEMALYSGQFKGKCRNCGKIGHKSFQCKNRGSQNGGSNGGNTSGGIYCTYCRKPGHVKQNCLKLKRKDSRLNSTNNYSSGNSNNSNRDRENFESQDMVFAATSDAEKFEDDVWICDSGASSHYCVSDRGMFDVRDIDEKIRVGNGNLLVATKIGNLKLDVTQINGTKLTITLQGVKFVPDLWVNLFSINQALKKGYRISNDDITISLSKGLNKITFDIFFKAKDGTVSGILMRPCDNPVAYTALNSVTKKGIEINEFHTMFGHCGSDRLERTARIHGFKLLGELKTCEQCAISKARQKNINKEWKGSSQIPGERLYIDISSIKNASYGGSKFWALVVDDHTDYCWSIFLKTKGELKDKMKILLTDLKISGIEVKYIRCDDSGENKAFYNDCRLNGELIKFEFSGPRTPQRNGKVERKFQTLYGRIRAMLNSAGLEGEIRSGVWSECANTVTFLSNMTSLKGQDKCPYQLLFGSTPKLPPNLKSFGEMGVVTTKSDIQGKLTNRGTTCMFVGYSVNHSNDVYRMLNLDSKRIIHSRDIIWLERNFKTWSMSKISTEKLELDDDDNDFTVKPTENPVVNSDISPNQQPALNERTKEKVYRQLKQLESSYNPEASTLIKNIEQGREILLDQASIALFNISSSELEPTTFDDAWNHPNSKDRELWRAAINKELGDMDSKKVWEIINKEDVPEGRRTIKCKWIF